LYRHVFSVSLLVFFVLSSLGFKNDLWTRKFSVTDTKRVGSPRVILVDTFLQREGPEPLLSNTFGPSLASGFENSEEIGTLHRMELVVDGASLNCSFGTSPSNLSVLPLSPATAGGKPVATIMDNKPFLNVKPFGQCSSVANPMVIAATAAALGVLTPQPCIPATVAPWVPGNQKVNLRQIPALDKSCTLNCMWAGVIQISDPKQTDLTA
jgi:hypothetical protein